MTVIVFTLALVSSHYYSRETFTIVPRSAHVAVDVTTVTQSTPGSGIMYELTPLRGTASTTIPATAGAPINTKAQGKVLFYNSFSSQSQRLIAGTRISDASGRIYRIASSVSVPGYTTKGAGVIPGSISATIVADLPGDTYNITGTDSVSDFKVVAYKGSSKYDSIYGRLTSPITGGFSGATIVTDQNLVASTSITLQQRIIAQLLAKAANTIPPGYVMYPNSYVTSFTKPVISTKDPHTATVSVDGTLYLILFNKADLADHLSTTTKTASFKPFGFTTPGIESLRVTITNSSDFSPDKKGALIVKMLGSFDIIGAIPVDEIKKKLIGLPLSNVKAVLNTYGPVVFSGTAELSPQWARVPTDPSRISIIIQDKP